jgi:outer membrane receptor protein involved in Fe transport
LSSAQYVTPFTDVTQVVTQPISATPIAGHVVAATTGYDLSQAQSLYSQQMLAGGADRFGGPNSLSATARADPHTVSIQMILIRMILYAIDV